MIQTILEKQNLPTQTVSHRGWLHLSELRAVITSSAVKSILVSVATAALLSIAVQVGDHIATNAEAIFGTALAGLVVMVWSTLRSALAAAKASADEPVKL